MAGTWNTTARVRSVALDTGTAQLEGDLAIPEGAHGLVVFVHGSGSSRHSPRNRSVAGQLQGARLGTLLFDLLTPQEEAVDEHTRALRFDIGLLTERLTGALDWLRQDRSVARLPVGLFGASTGVAAALQAAILRPDVVKAVVSRGGRPDMARAVLAQVVAPTLLVVGGDDPDVLYLNRTALALLPPGLDKRLVVIPHAGHLFEGPGQLEEVARLATDWFKRLG
jgi:putative phosphoribosyl transferase